MGAHSHGLEDAEASAARVKESHHEFLASILGSTEKAKDAIIHSYTREFNAFAATLEEEEAAEIARHPRVISVFLNRGKHLHTTHSWDFMLLEKDGVVHPSSIWSKADYGKDIIIGNLDTGVWPESQSFSAKDFGAVPSKWKGSCMNDTNDGVGVPCNRKLIGAKFYYQSYYAGGGSLNSTMLSARDYEGHGSHTLSTAGGNFVPGATVNGNFNGTAKGGSPKARVAAYKVCWPPIGLGGECFDGDILSAFEAAIHDGVDVLSLSLGGFPADYMEDTMAIGAFHAIRKGIVVVCSAGNEGPDMGTVTNVAPWIITVGASTIDRQFEAVVELANGKRFKGTSLSAQLPSKKQYPLITGAQAKLANSSAEDANLCEGGTLDPKKVKGKILVCLRGGNARVDKGVQAYIAGAAGMILCNNRTNGDEIIADPHLLPASHITYKDGVAVFAYVNNNQNATGYIDGPFGQLKTQPAPSMAAFSSMGPNIVTPEILKPDITAPGVSIIAAFSGASSPTENAIDTRRFAYNVESGTSMSCPHVSGVVGLLKKLHPDWSPAAIKSAIMTTARTRDNTENPMLDGLSQKATPFSYGAGHIRPNHAMNPGLVYDLTPSNYLDFLCGLGYNQTTLQYFSGKPHKCPKKYSILDFNYPSITIPNLACSATARRTVKLVGSPGIYAARIRQPAGVSVTVKPKVLKFEKIGEKKSFKLTFKNKYNNLKGYVFGELLWSDGKHNVRSPIVVASGG
ncbi:Tripeptidyl-peptidase II, partial [Bertholletia excelsa]